MPPLPTDEDKPLHATSIYAISKKDQEEMCLAVGRTYGIPTVALRYFNVYGSRQALSNPYTGVAAIFSGRLLNGKPPVIFEDGLQSRDFVHVSDIVQANLLVMEQDAADYGVFNVGSGRAVTILDVAEALIDHLGCDVEPEIVQQFRAGDIRHCFADISRLRGAGLPARGAPSRTAWPGWWSGCARRPPSTASRTPAANWCPAASLDKAVHCYDVRLHLA